METKLYGVFIFLKGKEKNLYFCITPKNKQFHKPKLHFPGLKLTKKTNHSDISLTGTDYCNSKLSIKKYIHLSISIFQKKIYKQDNHSPSVVFWKEFAFALKDAYGKVL